MNKYQSYKPSSVEWIGEVPTEWSISKYKYNLSILSGFPFKSESFDIEVGFPLLRIRDITSGTIETYYNGDFDEKYIIKKGDVVIGMDGDFNIREWDNEDILLNQRCCKIQNTNGLLLKFVFYTLPFDLQIINDLTYYTTVKHLSVDDLYNIKCVIPPIYEQHQIVRYLDEKTELIDKFISTKERKLTLLKEQRISLINEVVTKGLNPNVKMKDSGVEWIGKIPEHWGMKKVKYLFQIRKRISGELGYDILSVTQKGLKIKDIISGKGQLSMDYTKYQIVYPNDFVMNHMDLLTGYVDVSKWLGVTSPDYRVFTLIDSESLSEYYLRIFQFGYQNKVFYGFGQGSSMLGRWRLPSEEFNNFYFPYPSKNEQTQIVEHINLHTKEIDNLVQLEQEKIDLLKEYRKSLISEVVTGKIKVTTDE
jgi:type I restriction enzyme S subunit